MTNPIVERAPGQPKRSAAQILADAFTNVAIMQSTDAEAADVERRTQMAARSDKFRLELREANDLLADALPKARYALQLLAELLARIEEYGESAAFEEITNGLKIDGVNRLLGAIEASVERGSPLSDPYVPLALRGMLKDTASESRRRVMSTARIAVPPTWPRDVDVNLVFHPTGSR